MHDRTRDRREHSGPRRLELSRPRSAPGDAARLDRLRSGAPRPSHLRVLPLRGPRSSGADRTDLPRDLLPARMAGAVRRLPLDPDLSAPRRVVPVAKKPNRAALRSELVATLARRLADALGRCARVLLADSSYAASGRGFLLASGIVALDLGDRDHRRGARNVASRKARSPGTPAGQSFKRKS